MKRVVLTVCAVVVLVAMAMFAPTPVSRTAEAEEQRNNACPGLQQAYEACREHNPNAGACEHIREQLFQHGCYASSSSGSGSWSGSS
jgi:hypothetical protein